MALPIAICAGAACVGEDPTLATEAGGAEDATAKDAAIDDATGADAAGGDAGLDADSATGPRCDPTKPWGAPQEVPGLKSGSLEGGGRLSPDELTIYFSSDRAPSTTLRLDTWVATRADRSSAFGAPVHPSGITTIKNQIWPSPTGDGLTLYYLQDDEVSMSDVMKAKRTSLANSFGPATPVATLASTTIVTCPYVLPNESALYFSSRGDAGTKNNLFRSSPPGAPPVLISDLVGDPFETYCAAVLPNELEMVFSSNRGSTGAHHDLYATKRASDTAPWGTATAITQLNTGSDEFVNWISADGCALYFQRNVSVGSADYDLWYSVKPP